MFSPSLHISTNLQFQFVFKVCNEKKSFFNLLGNIIYLVLIQLLNESGFSPEFCNAMQFLGANCCSSCIEEEGKNSINSFFFFFFHLYRLCFRRKCYKHILGTGLLFDHWIKKPSNIILTKYILPTYYTAILCILFIPI